MPIEMPTTTTRKRGMPDEMTPASYDVRENPALTPLHVPKFSEPATAATAGPSPLPAIPAAAKAPARGRWFTLFMLASVCGSTAYVAWNSLFQFSALGVVVGHVVAVRPPWEARVVRVHVNDGEAVSAGQVLLTLDDTTLRTELARQQEALQEAVAGLAAEEARLEHEYEVDQDRRQKAIAEYHTALGALYEERERLKLAASILERTEAMNTLQAASENELDEARHNEAGRRKKVASLEIAVDGMRKRTGFTTEASVPLERQLQPYREKVKSLTAVVERCQVELAKARVLAPVSGTIVKREALPGDSVSADSAVLLLLEKGTTEVALFVPQRSAGKFQIGERITVAIRPRASLTECEIVRIGLQMQSAPKSLDKYYSSNEPLLPVYVRALEGPETLSHLKLGSVAGVPRLQGLRSMFNWSDFQSAASDSLSSQAKD